MKTIRTAALPLLLLLAGCATTPSQRIQKNQDLFDSFPVAAQARIRGGQIDLHFTPDMVRIALGDPQRQVVRRTADGDSEIWYYIETVQSYDRQRVDLDGLTLYGVSGSRTVGGSAWVNILQQRESVRVRVEFRNGRVAAIEELGGTPAKP